MEEERKQRAAEIARMAAEFSKPVVWKSPSSAAGASSTSKSTSAGQNRAGDVLGASQSAKRDHQEEEEEDSSDSSDSSSSSASEVNFPVSSAFELPGHSKFVTCVGLDKAGLRLATGSLDGVVNLWDFAAGASLETPKPFRTITGQSKDAESRAGSQSVVSTFFNYTGFVILRAMRFALYRRKFV